MSLLTDTQGTPDRVWSTLNAVSAADGVLSREDLAALLNPAFVRSGETRIINDAHKQAIGAAGSLGLIELEAGVYKAKVEKVSSYLDFSDRVHDRLCSIGSDDADYLVLEAFAWMSMEIDRRQSLQWCSESADGFAAAVEKSIGNPVGGELRFNRTKVPPWRRWLQFLNLAIELPGSLGFYPCVSGRLARVLALSNLARDAEIPIADFMNAVAAAMPYLDGGALQNVVSSKSGANLERRKVSRLLSMALRDLEDDGVIDLVMRGDAANTFELAADDRPAKTVLAVVVKGRQA